MNSNPPLSTEHTRADSALKEKLRLRGGPWNDKVAYVNPLPTVWFVVAGWPEGRYDTNGKWEPRHETA